MSDNLDQNMKNEKRSSQLSTYSKKDMGFRSERDYLFSSALPTLLHFPFI
jgi:hypothetical protein